MSILVKRRHVARLVIACVLCTAPWAWAWSVVGDGIEYQEYLVSGPNKLFVTRMERNNPNVIIESSIGQGRVSGGTERVSNQAARYDDAINYWGDNWGQRNDVVVAINGSYYDVYTGIPESGVVHSGWYSKRYDNNTFFSGFVWQMNRHAFIGACVTHLAAKQLVTYVSSGTTQQFKNINVPRGTNDFIIYTPQYDSNTLTDNSGVEVLVELSRPMLLMPSPNMVTGYVRQIRVNQGSTPIPFDHIVLSATGANATTLQNSVSIGAQIGVSQEIRGFVFDSCATAASFNWTKSYAAISGNWVFLRDGVIKYGIDTSGLRHPRTAIAYNDGYIYFVVNDGRSSASIGMTINELAEFCKNTLGATWGLNQDGGGSSTMQVNGAIKNVPSDGPERPVSNGLMMVNLKPRTQSSAFSPASVVKITATSAAVRLGPGTNYASIATLAKDTQGTILNHSLKGILAKGQYWWKCDFNGTTGWVQQNQVEALSTPPSIAQHPSPQAARAGATGTFSVQAQGTEPFTYRWQKANVDLDDDARYSGTTGSSLMISSIDRNDEAEYRCRVSNAVGSVTSNPARLYVISADFDGDEDVDQEDFGYLQTCLGSEDVLTAAPDCVHADLTLDNRVDEADFLMFHDCTQGPGIPVSPNCPE